MKIELIYKGESLGIYKSKGTAHTKAKEIYTKDPKAKGLDFNYYFNINFKFKKPWK